MTKNCLVLGGNGLIGSQVVEQLSKKNHSVKAFDLFKGQDNLQGIDAERIKADFLDEQAIKEALQGVDIVFHCLHTTFPKTSLERPFFDAKTNIIPSVYLLEQCEKTGVEKLVYISTLAVYGDSAHSPIRETDKLDPLIPYGISKMTIEKFVEFFGKYQGLDYAILRPTTTYGEKQHLTQNTGAVANFLSNAMHNKPITVYQKGTVRDFLHVEDLARGILDAAFRDSEDKIFNLGSGQGISLTELIEKISRITKTNPKVEYLEQGEIKELVCDITRAKEQLGWQPKVSLNEGIERLFKAWGVKDA